jgi:hypothetical protein
MLRFHMVVRWVTHADFAPDVFSTSQAEERARVAAAAAEAERQRQRIQEQMRDQQRVWPSFHFASFLFRCNSFRFFSSFQLIVVCSCVCVWRRGVKR